MQLDIRQHGQPIMYILPPFFVCQHLLDNDAALLKASTKRKGRGRAVREADTQKKGLAPTKFNEDTTQHCTKQRNESNISAKCNI
jgi:hypothetical protein